MAATRPWIRIGHLVIAHRLRLLTLFGVLAEDVIDSEGFFFDDPLLLYAHGLATAGRDAFMLLISRLGYQWGVIPATAASLLWLLFRRRRLDSIFFGLAVIGAALLNQTAKFFFGRARPKLWPSVAPEPTFSFPSGHAMGSTALVAALVVLL